MKLKKLLSMILVVALVVTTASFTPSAVVEAKAKKKYVKSIKVSKSVTIIKGNTKTLKVKVKVKGKASKKFTVKSKNKKVASVKIKKQKIVIKAKKIGTTKILISSKGKSKKGKKLKRWVKVSVVSKATPIVTKPTSESTTVEEPAATTYYKNNSKIIKILSANDSDDVFTEEQVKKLLEDKGFEDFPITFDYSIDGERINDTEINDNSENFHPMYHTTYISKSGEAWSIYVINGEIFANPISFNLDSDLKSQLLFSESETLTSYDDETNQFYVTIPHSSGAIISTVENINTETLDSLTIEKICELTGASLANFSNEDEEESESGNLLNTYSTKNMTLKSANGANVNSTNSGYSVENPLVVVSLGDSYASGEGVEPFYNQDMSLANRVKNDDWLAHRSQMSWPAQLRVPGVVGTMGKYKTGLNETNNAECQWYFAASSGAETTHFWNKQKKEYSISTGLTSEKIQGTKYLPPQKDVFSGLKGEVDYVTLSIGGNDVGFANIIIKCAEYSMYLHFGTTAKVEDLINDAWDNFYETRSNIKQVYEDIKSLAGTQAAIIVTGYPQLLDPNGKGFVISKREASLINENVHDFNEELKEIVEECQDYNNMNIYFVDIEKKFGSTHAAYSSSPWINKIMFTKQSQDLDNHLFGSAYSIHPNAMGAQKYATFVNEKIEEIEEEKKNQLRIVLDWGDEPEDLDSHLVGPTGDWYGDSFHVYYSHKYDSDVDLDVDDRSGNGKETIVVRKINQGVYTYAVHNYSDKSDIYSNTLSLSQARVRVYRGETLLATYNVPSGDGTLWTVFSYDSDLQQLKTINSLSYESDSYGVLDGIDTE